VDVHEASWTADFLPAHLLLSCGYRQSITLHDGLARGDCEESGEPGGLCPQSGSPR
jgi:hypothetical protein